MISRGDTRTISWNTTGAATGPTVNIFVLGSTSTSFQALAVPNTGSYDLFFPASLKPGTNCFLMVIST